MFQAEVLAISEVAKNLLLEKMHNQSIVALVDSQTAIKSLIKCTATSITVLNCIRNLNQLRKKNHVSIAWIPGHARVHGNEVADYVAKSGSNSKIHGLEPFITVPYRSKDGNSAAYAAARCCWCTAPRSVAAKICITSQSQRSAAYNNFFTFFCNYCW